MIDMDRYCAYFLTAAAAKSATGPAILVAVFRNPRTLIVEDLSQLKG